MKVSIKFSLASGNASDLPIRIRVSYDGLRLDLRSGYVCPPDAWDTTSMRMRPGTSNRYGEKASAVNARLSKQEADINTILTRYELDGLVPDPSVLKVDFDSLQGRKVSSKKTETFLSVIDLYVSEKGHTLQPATLTSYSSLNHCLKNEAFSNKPINDIVEDDLSDYVESLLDDGLQNSTIKNYIHHINSMLRYAHKKGIYSGNLHNTFVPDLIGVKKDVMYLEWDEFLALYNLYLPKDRQRIVRDMFCLCCTTGLRISDCMALSWSHVVWKDTGSYIHLIAKKTKKQTIIELNDYSRAILERYTFRSGCPTIFPDVDIINGPTLRNIASYAGLTRQVRRIHVTGAKVTEEYRKVCDVISSHWGRHTFIVRALSLGISPVVVMAWTGHSSYEALRPYIAIASKEKAQNMSLFNAPGNAPEK